MILALSATQLSFTYQLTSQLYLFLISFWSNENWRHLRWISMATFQLSNPILSIVCRSNPLVYGSTSSLPFRGNNSKSW